MSKLFSSEALIRFSDCDPMGHLNNMRYLDYFLNAREDHLLKYANFDIYQHVKNTGHIWVMFQNKITYLKPVFYNNFVTITSQVIQVTPKSIQVEMQMKDSKSGELKCVLWMIAVYFDVKNNKSATHQPEISSMLQNFLMPVEQTTFDQRVKFLQNK
ncbi:MAG TPA: acyl-CoA thioesterase [Saprospiraceae bacterium]|nr:acyl-CoA thioesterase [Saprospiraceae bacterium]